MACHHLFHHPQTPEEREAIVNQLNYCRRIGDGQGAMIALVQLTEPCFPLEPDAEGAK
ncbi:hypothetical protein [Nonomuraea sp. SYSU D8015]|uniref:hypothetical protein n=1 Tax=Nonomuraea sp. SYSU D8015 TaxID=2593644 RepID=UPI0016601C26|nr:hypothetical protein [Nonomuraea sp. SYSU D8015]